MKVGTLSRIARWAGGFCVALVMAGVSSVGHAAVLSPSTPLEYVSGYIPATFDSSFSNSYNVQVVDPNLLVTVDFTDVSTTFKKQATDPTCPSCNIDALTVTFHDTINAVSDIIYSLSDLPVSFILPVSTYQFTIAGTTNDFGGAYDVKLTGVLPIPGAALLFGSGLAFLGLSGRRRFKKAV